jgi:hypothetical protein
MLFSLVVTAKTSVLHYHIQRLTLSIPAVHFCMTPVTLPIRTFGMSTAHKGHSTSSTMREVFSLSQQYS